MEETRMEENKKRFEELFSRIKRAGADRLLVFIREKTDFYSAPASTKYHLSKKGGLLQHSLNVYDALMAEKANPILGKAIEKVSEETIIIVSLLHDLCKTFYYVESTKNQKTYDPEKVAAADPHTVKHDNAGNFIWETVPYYTVKNKYPLGHGAKSVFFIMRIMPLTIQEITAINWHMGAYCGQDQWNELGEAYETCPLALALHHADMVATHVLEKE